LCTPYNGLTLSATVALTTVATNTDEEQGAAPVPTDLNRTTISVRRFAQPIPTMSGG
jgi:hypothetical protein